MVLEILYKICLGLIFILVTSLFFLHVFHIGSYIEPSFSFSFEEFSPIAENVIAYEVESNNNM